MQKQVTWLVLGGLICTGHTLVFSANAPVIPAYEPGSCVINAQDPGSQAGMTNNSESAIKKTTLNLIDQAMLTAIQKKQTPGGVIFIAHQGTTVYHKAFGNLSLKPKRIKAQKDSIYDVASLTKLFTATLIMRLHDKGVINVYKPISTYLDMFEAPDKKKITLEQLLTHRSGLPAGLATQHFEDGIGTAVEKIAATPLKSKPGTNFLYSDLGPIVAGYLAQKVTGKSLSELFREYIFRPLNLKDTYICPPKRLLPRIAAYDYCNGVLVHGRVHDPIAYALGGCAGNAGIFSTATDIAKLGQLFLNNGQRNDKQLLSTESITAMTTADESLPKNEQRGIGFDINTAHTFPRGKLFSTTSYGHTGFTGTSLWVDPETQTVVAVLTNRLHPDGKGDTKELRSTIGTLAAKMVKTVDDND